MFKILNIFSHLEKPFYLTHWEIYHLYASAFSNKGRVTHSPVASLISPNGPIIPRRQRCDRSITQSRHHRLTNNAAPSHV